MVTLRGSSAPIDPFSFTIQHTTRGNSDNGTYLRTRLPVSYEILRVLNSSIYQNHY